MSGRHRCARCKSPMHPMQNCRREPDGIICMRCFDGPKILWAVPAPDDVRLN